MQRAALRFIFFIMIMGCASKYDLESNSFINTTESYYSVWNSPIRDGGSGYSIYVVLDEKLDLNASQIEIQGIYFKDKFSTLKYQKPGLYQGFIKNKIGSKSLEMEGVLKNNTVKEKEIEKIPFKLTDQEAVVVYKENAIQKYTKINLRKKETFETPM